LRTRNIRVSHWPARSRSVLNEYQVLHVLQLNELPLLQQTVLTASMTARTPQLSEPEMTLNKAGKKSLRTANFGFSALLLTLFGWINLEILAVSNSASIRSQLLTFAFGASLSTIGYRRYKTWWVPLAQSMHGESSQSSFRTYWGAIILLASAGFLLACTMRMDLITSVAVGAGTLTFIPWA
jgi:hypothetical protein